MTDWNRYFEDIISTDPWPQRFKERWPDTTPEVKVGYTELTKIESNVAGVRMLGGKYEVLYQIPVVTNSVRLMFIRTRRYPFHIPDFRIAFSYIVTKGGLLHEKGDNEYGPITVEEATRLTLEDLKYLL